LGTGLLTASAYSSKNVGSSNSGLLSLTTNLYGPVEKSWSNGATLTDEEYEAAGDVSTIELVNVPYTPIFKIYYNYFYENEEEDVVPVTSSDDEAHFLVLNLQYTADDHETLP